MINAGIVGMGGWGRTLVESVSGGSDMIRFIAGTTGTPSRATDYAAKAGLHLHESLDDLLADDDIDAVVLASPHTIHFRQILAAASAGKHVYCEKPFCLTSDQAAQALDALAAKGLKAARWAMTAGSIPTRRRSSERSIRAGSAGWSRSKATFRPTWRPPPVHGAPAERKVRPAA